MTVDLTYEERNLVMASVDRYIHDLRTACAEDQGNPDGEPGTFGHELQRKLNAVKNKVCAVIA